MQFCPYQQKLNKAAKTFQPFSKQFLEIKLSSSFQKPTICTQAILLLLLKKKRKKEQKFDIYT
jgi:hypothetical protein